MRATQDDGTQETYHEHIRSKIRNTDYADADGCSRAAVDIPQGQTRTFWLTVYVSPSTAPGFYSGDIGIGAHGGQETRRRLLLRVLPMRLPSPEKGYGFWWTTDDRWRGYFSEQPDQAREQTRKQFIMLRERGCNLVSLFVLPRMTRDKDGLGPVDIRVERFSIFR
jgi:hypothetical protein